MEAAPLVQAQQPMRRPGADSHQTPLPNFDHIDYATRAGVATVTLSRPDALNSYTTDALRELATALETATADDGVGVIVLTGAGSRAFCTGGDVKEYASVYTKRPHDYWKYMGVFRRAVEAILDCGKPTIARINGLAIGGGNELQLACDLSIAAHHAELGQVGVGVGSVACGGATQWLPLAVGDRRARAMLLLNERVPARLAETWGLVWKAVPSVVGPSGLLSEPSDAQVAHDKRGEDGFRLTLDPLDAAVEETATRLLGMFPECLRYTREQVNFWKRFAWDQTVGHGREWLTLHFAHREPHEGMGAFAAKRKPRVAQIRQMLAEGGSPEYLHGPPTRSCGSCGAPDLPEAFTHCGHCGGRL